ncbi:MAG: SIS domain-containing protein, partial [Micromonosporaceae bacterium]|nr:SIS domain-containing protein [Micromonosporaceae bacterium]
MTKTVRSGRSSAAAGGLADPLTADHLESLRRALPGLQAQASILVDWGAALATVLVGDGRLLVAGNGGSAAEAQHLAAELVGRMRSDRRPLSAIVLSAETSSLTAIGNDYGYAEVFARQVRAHGRPGDVLLTLSTSGRSPNLLAASAAAREVGMVRWALTGPAPNPLAQRSDAALCVDSPDPQTVQELHLVCVHLLCAHIEAHLPRHAFPPEPPPAANQIGPAAEAGQVSPPAAANQVGPAPEVVEVTLAPATLAGGGERGTR